MNPNHPPWGPYSMGAIVTGRMSSSRKSYRVASHVLDSKTDACQHCHLPYVGHDKDIDIFFVQCMVHLIRKGELCLELIPGEIHES